MSGLGLWFALAGAEVVLVLFGLLTFSWYRNRAQRQRDRKAVKALVAGVAKARDERDAAIRKFLTQSFGLDGDALDQCAVPITREETRLYQTFANLYLKRDAGGVVALQLAVEAAVAPYWTLSGQVATEDGAAAPADDGEMARLRAENEQLSVELQITMNTMTRMLNEYSAMFAGSAGVLTEPPEAAQEAAAATAPEEVVEPAVEDDAELLVVDDASEAPPEVTVASQDDDVDLLVVDEPLVEAADAALDKGDAPVEDVTGILDDDVDIVAVTDTSGVPAKAAQEEVIEAEDAEAVDALADAFDQIEETPDSADDLVEDILDGALDADTADASIDQILDQAAPAAAVEAVPEGEGDSVDLAADISEFDTGPAADGKDATDELFEGVSNDAADELLADALGDTDLALDDLDDLFDGVPADSDDDDKESVAL